MESNQNKKTVYVAMSGGVDSSVAAMLLKKRGFNVVGVFMKPWSPQSQSNYRLSTIDYSPFCLWQKDREDAMRVASILGIKFKTWDFSREYGHRVARYMIESYRGGITPNPDVMCNKEIKFGLFLRKALNEGADFIATGHYVKIERLLPKADQPLAEKSKNENLFRLFKAKDGNKDQSYFLWTLTQDQLKYCLFPIGDYLKPQVRKLARRFGLPNHAKKDSQGVCFVGPLDMRSFLKDYIRPRTGEVRLINNGRVIGRHDGAYYYTIGQRRGLGLGTGGGPYYVAAKDLDKNIIYVTTDAGKISSLKLNVGDVNWIQKNIKLPLKAEVKIRYRNDSTPARILKNGDNRSLAVKFSEPVKAATLGQSAVFYKGNEVLGGGIII